MKKLSTNEIRKIWIKFWEEKEHEFIEAKSLVPYEDESLLFINSGVATLKKYLSGEEVAPNPRLVNYQKSLRTNDIENVGVTARHHTMFEMLGNFSIGDYFKEEAIKWGWELLTSDKYFGLDKNNLYVTIHPDDVDSLEIWKNLGVESSKIIALEENFWEIGKGPGGPNTEIFFDRGDEYDSRNVIELLENDLETDRVIEIWNIVFSQYNCNPEIERKKYKELPQKNIDTGMGLERIACILQNVETNYETDNFIEIIRDLENKSNKKYVNNKKSFRIIADHIRALVFAIGDGVIPTNNNRGYVIRRILRRAFKYGYIDLELDNTFLYSLVNRVVLQFKGAYPELRSQQKTIELVIKREEESFLKTIKEGLKIFKEYTKDITKLSGEKIFKLYDTYGFPYELTEEIATDMNILLDKEGFDKELDNQRNRARTSRENISTINTQNEYLQNINLKSEFCGYNELNSNSKLLLITDLKKDIHKVEVGCEYFLLFDKTPFYATSGGQKCDIGSMEYFDVIDVIKMPSGQHLHKVIIKKKIEISKIYELQIDIENRNKITKNHSVTHLLQNILVKELGEDLKQAGSNQDANRTRFDFTYHDNLDEQNIIEINKKVKDLINMEYEVNIREMEIKDAKKIGAKALFGEKYGNIVRVVSMGPSIELCGGTHVSNTLDIENFLITSYQSIGNGIRRIEALTHDNVDKYIEKLEIEIDNIYKNLILELKSNKVIKLAELENYKSKTYLIENLDKKINKYIEELVRLNEINLKKNELEKIDMIAEIVKELENKVILEDNVRKIDSFVQNIDTQELKEVADKLLNENKCDIIILRLIQNTKISVVVKITDEITDKFHAGNMIKEILKEYNGRGGGRATMAQGGGEIK